MEDFKREEVITNPKDVQKLIGTYLAILKLDYKTDFEIIIRLFKRSFDFDITREDLLIYFTPTLDEFTEDLELQMKHLNL